MRTKSGKDVFPIGIGTWNMSSAINSAKASEKYKGVEPVYGNEVQEVEAIRYSISKGQNHLDCAELYGGFYTDEVVGRAIKGLKREDLYIADKLWKTSVGKGLVRATVEMMMKKLGTGYIDLLYIHAPWEGVDWQEATPQIDELIDEGIVRGFGVCNFSTNQLKEAQSVSKHPIVAVQQNLNVLYQTEADEKYRSFCKDNSIALVSYQPLKRQEIMTNDVIKNIATEHGVSASQIALAWLLSVGALPIPKAVQKNHIDDNLEALKVNLSDKNMKLLNELGAS